MRTDRDPPLRALIVDLDGTIADTLPMCIAAFQAAVERHAGRRPDEAEVRALFGATEEGMFDRMLGAEVGARAAETYFEEYARSHHLCPAPFDGLDLVFERAQARGLRLAIVTGKGPRSTAISLDVLGLAARFLRVECGSRGGSIKAERIAAVLRDWQIAPCSAAYLGDSPSDVEAARAAGVIALGAAWAAGTDRAALERTAPDACFASVGELAAWLECVRVAD